MKDRDKTRQQLIDENAELRQRVAALEANHGIFGGNRTITEHNRAEEALRESEARYRALAESTRDIIYILDRQGTLLYANRAAAQCIGIPPEEIVGRRQADLFPPEMAQAHVGKIGQVIATGAVLEEDELFHFGPEEVWLRIHLLPLRDDTGQITAVMGVCHNITDRKRAEKALQQAHDELERRVALRTAELTRVNEELDIFRKFAESSGEGFGMSGFDGRIAYANPTLCRLFGEERPEDVIGKSVLTYYPEEYRQRRKEEVIPALLREGCWHAEQTVLPRHGAPIQTLQSTFLIRDESENPFRIAVVISDITARKRAEEATRQLLRTVDEERGRLQAIIDSLPVGLWLADATGKMILINDAARAIWGGKAPYAEKTQDYGLYKAWWADTGKLIVAEDMPMVRSLRGETCKVEVIDFERFDGTIGTQLVSSTPIKTAEGTIIGSVAVVQDITARKRVEQSLHESEERYRTLVETSPDAVIMTDSEGRVTFASRRALQMYGTEDVAELLGRNPLDFFAPKDHQKFLTHLRKTLDEGVTRDVEYAFVRKDGTCFDGEASAAAIKDMAGNPQGFVAILRDITLRKQTQAALRQSRDQLQMIYDEMIEGLLITDIETTRIVRVNASMCRMLGYGQEELLRKSIPDLHPPEEVPNDLRRFQAAAEGKVSINEDRPVLRKDGSLFYADITGHRIVYEGRPCLLALFRNISERKQAQEARERERRTLTHMLRASDHERQLIAYDIHDGLAQYLTGAIMHLQMSAHLRAQSAEESAKAFEGGMALLRQGHSEARRLISGVRPPILDESGVMAAISHLIHDPACDQEPKVEFRSKVTFSRLAPVVENVIYRIVQEGLSNARKHSKSKKIVVSLVQRGQRLRIEVRDWGLGFDPQTIQENRFGLEGIRERARLLGGRCHIKSQPGEGTAVVVVLPVVEQKADDKEHPS